MGILNPPASGVTVRMYRQGLGDCFLLAFPTGQAGQAFYMLIDCGVIFGTQSPQQKMMDVATDIAAATGGDIHLLVATHEHWDHLSGFIQAGDVFKGMRIHNLWLAWTEDPSDTLAQQLGAEFHDNLEALRMTVNLASDPASVAPITNLLHFFGDPSVASANGLGSAATANTGAALAAIRGFISKMNASPQYRHPGEGPLPLPQVNGLPSVPGVRLYVLGPPHDEQKLKDINPSAKGKEVYTQAAALTAQTAFFMAVQDPNQLSVDDQVLRERSFPFDQGLRIPLAEAKQYEFFQTHYGFEDASAAASRGNTALDVQSQPANQDELAWRRIHDDWLESAGAFALQLDSYTNNTSLALAIELVNTKKVLMFVADAQIGNWLSWDDLSWSVPDATGTMQTIRIADLLARTVFYKVGHHGSFNATIRAYGQDKKGLELMTSPDLVAMIPVNHAMAVIKRWDMPFDPLLQRLEEKTSQRVMRIDDPFPKPQPDGMSDAAWQAFKANFEETPLYMQYTVTD
jgi:hypothetical protein